jgi:exodeoxyribonuclease X
MKVVIIDTETTGLAAPQAVEIAIITLPDDLQTFREVDLGKILENHQSTDHFEGVFERRYRPTKAIDPRASAVTGIYMKDVIHCPSIKTFEFPSSIEFIIAHNAVFDWGVLNKPDVKRICTKELSQLVFAGQKGLKNNKATTVTEFLFPEQGKEFTANAHGALADCKLVFYILHKVLERLPQVKTWEDLAKLCSQGEKGKSYEELDKPATILTSLPFGKHKGVPISEVPRDYLQWLSTQPNLSPSIHLTIKSLAT